MWDFKMILGILSVSDVSGPWARGPEKGRESAGWGQSSNLMAKVPCHVRSVHFQSWTTVHPWRPRTACPRQRLDQDAQWSWATKKHVSSKITEDIHFSSLVFFLQALNCLWSTHIHYWKLFYNIFHYLPSFRPIYTAVKHDGIVSLVSTPASCEQTQHVVVWHVDCGKLTARFVQIPWHRSVRFWSSRTR